MPSCGGCCLLSILVWPLLVILWALFGDHSDDDDDDVEKAVITTFLMD